MNFSLTQLEYVMAVHKYGHFGKAAQSCHVTQPTLSMQIHKLEEELGVVIFDRSKKPILLSEVGKKLIEQIQTVLFESKKIEEIIKFSRSGKVSGELSIGVIPTIAPYLLPLLLPVIETGYDDMELRLFEMQTHRIIEALHSDELDVGILATPIKEHKIFEFPLYYEPFSVLCKKDHSLAASKRLKSSHLKLDDIWLLEEGHCLRHQILDVCASKKIKNPKRKFHFESGSLETIKNLIDRYGGYTLLPQLATDHFGNHSVLIPFERPVPSREIGLVYRREHYKNDLIESLGEAILKAIPDAVRKLRPKDLETLSPV
jgi:LysR family hydrogen peroxide-inducible transcriptional activator